MARGRALLVRAGALGDVLLLRRAIFALHGAGFSVALLAPARSGSVLLGPGGSEVDALLDWERAEFAALFDDAPPPASLRLTLGGYDAAIVYSRSTDVAGPLHALVPRVVQHDPSPPAGTHASTWLCGPLALLGVAEAGDPPPLRPTADETEAIAPWLERVPPGFLALHPGSGSAAKNWPPARFAALASALASGHPWLLVEGPADEECAATLRELPGVVVARHLPPRVLAALLAQAGRFVGNDSGVSHLAAACGVNTLALFGPTDPSRWAPLGPNARVLRAPDGELDRLSVDAVLEALRSG